MEAIGIILWFACLGWCVVEIMREDKSKGWLITWSIMAAVFAEDIINTLFHLHY